MKNTLIATALISVMASGAFANEPLPTAETAQVAADTQTALPRLMTLVTPELQDGDLINFTRGFGNWLLRCEWVLSANKRVCAVEQTTMNEESGLSWKIAPSQDNKPLLLISAPANFDKTKGMRLAFSGLEKTLPESEWICSPKFCLTSFNFEGFVQAAIAKSPEVKFLYSVKTSDGQTKEVELTGPIDGMGRALEAAAVDPFGREALAKATADKPAPKAEAKPVAAVRPEREKAQPKKSAARPAPKVQREAQDTTAKKASGMY